MVQSLYSPSWYRVANLKPRLRSHVDLRRHHYRGELWYILLDHVSGKVHRFTPSAYKIIGLMNGSRTVQEIWDLLKGHRREELPTQEEIIQLLSQLHASDLLQSDVPPDTRELLERYEQQQKIKWQQSIGSPFAIRIPLFDPEKIVNFLSPLGRLIFSKVGLLIWLAVLTTAIFNAAPHWSELTRNITDRVLAPKNLFLLWLTFPIVKCFHEFGHALAVKRWGGEVHEMGIMLLVFNPIPYVDATSASAFPEKWRRIVVGAAGMMVELFIASLALMAWTGMEPGIARAIAYNVILIAGVSTLLFNGNPLLRYDGYYILSDLLEIPNLGPRGINYFGYLFKRYILRVKDLEEIVATTGERIWFVIYTVAAFIYRIFIYLVIILFVASKFFVVGVIIAIWGVITILILPIKRAISSFLENEALREKRKHAVAIISACVLVLLFLLFYAPFPYRTMVEGVTWIPDRSIVRAGTDGFIEKVLLTSGTSVKKGQELIACYDPLLPAEVKVLESHVRELRIAYDVYRVQDKVKAEMLKEEIKAAEAELRRTRERFSELKIKSPVDGIFIIQAPEDLPGKFVRKGETIAYVIKPSEARVRLVVPQSAVDLVRYRTRHIAVRPVENINQEIPAVIKREVPGATDTLPSKALGTAGGGKVAIDPTDARGNRSFHRLFEFELELLDVNNINLFGNRVYVLFDHGHEPLGVQCYRGIRRIFLKRFHI